LEAPGGPEDGYSTDSSLSREMRALGPAIEDVDLSDIEEADVTVVEVSSTNKLRKGFVIGCDANAHHTQWGCPSNKGRGESLFDFILNSNLFLCNRGKVPTFIAKRS